MVDSEPIKIKITSRTPRHPERSEGSQLTGRQRSFTPFRMTNPRAVPPLFSPRPPWLRSGGLRLCGYPVPNAQGPTPNAGSPLDDPPPVEQPHVESGEGEGDQGNEVRVGVRVAEVQEAKRLAV